MAKTLEISTTDFDRPVISIDGQKYEMRPPEELTFEDFALQARLGTRMVEVAEGGIDEDSLTELQGLVAQGIHLLLVDVPDDVVSKVNPGNFRRLQSFFNKLTDADEAEVSESDLKSSPGASDSTEAPEEERPGAQFPSAM